MNNMKFPLNNVQAGKLVSMTMSKYNEVNLITSFFTCYRLSNKKIACLVYSTIVIRSHICQSATCLLMLYYHIICLQCLFMM